MISFVIAETDKRVFLGWAFGDVCGVVREGIGGGAGTGPVM